MSNLANAINFQSFNAFVFLRFEFPYFVKIVTGYQPAKFQILQLSESNFTEVGIRHHKKPLWRHYDVTSQYLVFEIVHFVDLTRRYHPGTFDWTRLSG